MQLQTSSLRIVALLADGLRGEFALTVRPLTQSIIMKCKEKRLLGEVTLAMQNILKYCLGERRNLLLIFDPHPILDWIVCDCVRTVCRVRVDAGGYLRAHSKQEDTSSRSSVSNGIYYRSLARSAIVQ